MRSLADAEQERHRLSRSEWAVYITLHTAAVRADDCTITDSLGGIARAVDVNSHTIAAKLRALENIGLISIESTSPMQVAVTIH